MNSGTFNEDDLKRDYFYRISTDGRFAIKLSLHRSSPGFGDLSFVGVNCVRLGTTRTPLAIINEPVYYRLPENMKFFEKNFKQSDISGFNVEPIVKNPLAVYLLSPNDGDLAFSVYSGNKVYIYKGTAFQPL